MPTFNFADEFSPLERRVYMKAARVACRELGVEQVDATINIQRCSLGRNTHAAIAKHPDCYTLLLDEYNDVPVTVHALGHELIHFAQFVRGDLRDDGESVISWKGVQYDKINAVNNKKAAKAYLAQPWEAEAFAKHDELFKIVTEAISPNDRSTLVAEVNDRLDKLFLEFAKDLLTTLAGEQRDRQRSGSHQKQNRYSPVLEL